MEDMPGKTAEAFVHIIGSNMLQNKLLLSYIKKETGFHGRCTQNATTAIQNTHKASNLPQFFLVDCNDLNAKSFWNDVYSLKISNGNRHFLVFCNVEPEMKIEKSAIANGIKGIFYKSDHPKLIRKGISAILNGDLWYSRKVLSRLIIDKNNTNPSKKRLSENMLSERQREILEMIVSGHSGRKIAKKLNISAHTVKTHTYHLYKKLKVNNRLQATLWASKNL